MNITLQIPTKSYLKKYLEVSFGKDIKLTERNWLGVMVLNILKRKTFKNPSYDFKKYNYTYDVEITVSLHIGQAYRNGSVLLEPQKYFLNRSIDQIFKEELIKQALINQSNYNIDFKTSILNILEAYDIADDELDYQTIRKYFNRNYKRFQNRMIF